MDREHQTEYPVAYHGAVVTLRFRVRGRHLAACQEDKSIPIYTEDPLVMNDIKAQFVPAEFHNMVVFFNDHTLASWYRKVEEHSSGLQYWQPLQAFLRVFQDFDYYWQFGNEFQIHWSYLPFSRKVHGVCKRQPRIVPLGAERLLLYSRNTWDVK
ncbi:Protein of unknown function DUF3405 [Penicillium cf. griseofulvum]|nr:Protein of unknown function DUF3405 [Penicillium cf. griseofulvum]